MPPPIYGPPPHCCFHFISSFREESGNNDLLHPEECPSLCCRSPPRVTAPNFLNLNKMRIPQSLKNASPSVLHARIHSTPFTRLTPNPLSISPILPSAHRNVCPSASSLSALRLSLNCKVPMFSQRESLNTPCQQHVHTHTFPLYTDTLERKKKKRHRRGEGSLGGLIFLKLNPHCVAKDTGNIVAPTVTSSLPLLHPPFLSNTHTHVGSHTLKHQVSGFADRDYSKRCSHIPEMSQYS